MARSASYTASAHTTTNYYIAYHNEHGMLGVEVMWCLSLSWMLALSYNTHHTRNILTHEHHAALQAINKSDTVKKKDKMGGKIGED